MLPFLWLAACDAGLSEAECHELRRAAYEVVYRPHPCSEDADCVPSEWPGCPRPLGSAAFADIAPFHARFTQGGCKSADDAACAPAPEAYCDRNLCIFRIRAPR